MNPETEALQLLSCYSSIIYGLAWNQMTGGRVIVAVNEAANADAQV